MILRILFILLLSTAFVFSQSSQTNFRIFPSPITQTEPIVTISKSNPPVFFVSAVTINTAGAFRSEGIYLSTNGGNNWFGSDTCKGQLLLNHGGDPGIAITASNRLVLTHIGSVFPGVYSHYSDDLGTTWSNAYTINSQQTDDKGTTIVDDNINSPYFGRIYSAFVKQISPYPIYLSFSINNAESWSNPSVINNQPAARCVGPSVAIDKDGRIFAAWAAVTSQSPFFEDYIGFASSTNGGSTWVVTNNIFDVNGITGTLPAKNNIRVNGLPRIAIDKSNGFRNGWLYIITAEKNNLPAGSDPDLVLHRSTDAGQTWSSGIRINQDNLNDGKIQYFPAIDIDEYGNLNVIYYDDRNTTSDSSEVFLSRSTNGGDTWFDEVISDHKFKPKPVFGGSSNYQGDYISLLYNNHKLYAFWMDDFSGIYQIWLKIINVDPNGIEDNNGNFEKVFMLEQNFPNPFNPTTEISYSIPNSGSAELKEQFVTLKVFDVLGNEVETLIDERKAAGNYKITFNAEHLVSGVYFYQLTAGNFIQTKKMILIR